MLADGDLSVLAGRNVDVLAAANTQQSESHGRSSSVGVGLGGGASARFTNFSSTSASQEQSAEAVSQSTSLLSANSGDLTVRAGLDTATQGTGAGNITTQGADLLAGDAVTLSGRAIDLQAVSNETSSHSAAQARSVTIGSALAGALGSQITAISDKIEQAQSTDNSRLQGALALKAGYDAYKFGSALSQTGAGAASGEQIEAARKIGGSPGAASASSGFGVSVSISSTRNKSESETHDVQVSGTNVQAKRIDVTASETDLRMAAAKLQAETIELAAQRDVILEAAANSSEVHSSNSGSSVGGGVTFAFGGQQNGFSFQLNASQSKGRTEGQETVWDNTLITATDKLKVTSGGDATLKGAQLAGGSVALDIGGDLVIQTLQDSSVYDSQQKSMGLSLSLCIPPICAGTMVTGSVSASSQSIKHNYLSAVGQSGIAAGEGGFDITVKGGTELVGAAITSGAAASDNHLTTASLASSDLANAQSTQSKSRSFSAGYEGGSAVTALAKNAAQNVLSNLQGNAALPQNGSQSGTTQSVISPASITLTGSGDAAKDAASRQTAEQLTTRDAATANGSLANTLTLQQAQELQGELRRQQENAAAARLVGAVLSNVVGDVATKQQWPDGSPQKLALHGMVGLIEAKISGGNAAAGVLGAMSQEAMAPVLAEYLEKSGIAVGSDEYKSLLQLGATLVGAAVGALATGDVKGASTGANAAFEGVTNNYLKHDEAIRMAALQDKKRKGECGGECQQEIDTLKQKDELRNAVLDSCQGVSSTICDTARQEVRSAAAEYLRKETIALNLGTGSTLVNVYASENQETRQYANGTLDGKALGAIGGAWDTVKAAFGLAGTLLGSAFGNESSQQALKAGASTAWDYVRNPDNWPYLIGVMTPEQREQLAQAYEKGDGNAVGRFMGEQVTNILSNLPSGGVAAGTIKIAKAVDKVEGAARTVKVVEAVIFEQSLVNLTAGERGAVVKTAAKTVAENSGWEKEQRLSKMNDRDVYKAPDGSIYSLDTQHGAWEKINPKTGAHEGQVRLLDLEPQKVADASGRHNLKVK